MRAAVSEMKELFRTKDLVLISFVEVLLRDAGIETLVVDEDMNMMMPFGMMPRRILVPEASVEEARRLIFEADLGKELP